MDKDWRSLLVPEVLNEVSGLEIIARVIVEGYLSGLHASRKTGAGLEFSQYRAYEPGDDLRLLDWKMLARSGRYYVKQADIETNVVLRVVMDSSASMAYEEEDVSKWTMARIIAAALAYLASKQRDDIGLFTLNDTVVRELHVKEDSRQLQRFLQQLIDLNVQGSWPDQVSTGLTPSRDKKEIVVFISDFLQEKDELVSSLTGLKTSYNEVLGCYIAGRMETDLAFQGQFVFEDLESGRRAEVNADKVREEYVKKLTRYRQEIQTTLEDQGIAWLSFYLDENPGKILASYIKQRNRLIR